MLLRQSPSHLFPSQQLGTLLQGLDACNSEGDPPIRKLAAESCSSMCSIQACSFTGTSHEDLDEEAAARLREQMEASLQNLTSNFMPGEADDHGRNMWTRCEALTAGKP